MIKEAVARQLQEHLDEVGFFAFFQSSSNHFQTSFHNSLSFIFPNTALGTLMKYCFISTLLMFFTYISVIDDSGHLMLSNRRIMLLPEFYKEHMHLKSNAFYLYS